jgi:organic hydroperoxide reductase OsmC/OhrA
MSVHGANIVWQRNGHDFAYESYTRNHVWRFTNGTEVAASAAPEFLGDPSCVDPEAAFVASLASCHMLTFLAIAARKRLVVDSYSDDAIGYLEKNEDGRLAMTRVELRPKIAFGEGSEPDADALKRLHESAHRQCFIANSVITRIVVTD